MSQDQLLINLDELF